METLLSCAGFFLFLFLLSEDFQQFLLRLQTLLQNQPRWKYLAYPLGALLFAGAAVLFSKVLINFATITFSYE